MFLSNLNKDMCVTLIEISLFINLSFKIYEY